ncbi:MAG: hypothetical protein V7L05_04185 [Nostoc sp.]|uniref:hypothetical protein n=1 Tax=Nostoc sp. TaxID=1180 RepID=UPI002FFBBD1C
MRTREIALLVDAMPLSVDAMPLSVDAMPLLVDAMPLQVKRLVCTPYFLLRWKVLADSGGLAALTYLNNKIDSS